VLLELVGLLDGRIRAQVTQRTQGTLFFASGKPRKAVHEIKVF
jgi:hypothetical protein